MLNEIDLIIKMTRQHASRLTFSASSLNSWAYPHNFLLLLLINTIYLHLAIMLSMNPILKRKVMKHLKWLTWKTENIKFISKLSLSSKTLLTALGIKWITSCPCKNYNQCSVLQLSQEHFILERTPMHESWKGFSKQVGNRYTKQSMRIIQREKFY